MLHTRKNITIEDGPKAQRPDVCYFFLAQKYKLVLEISDCCDSRNLNESFMHNNIQHIIKPLKRKIEKACLHSKYFKMWTSRIVTLRT